jgi:hypothetical protein
VTANVKHPKVDITFEQNRRGVSHINDGAVQKFGVLNDTRHGRVE